MEPGKTATRYNRERVDATILGFAIIGLAAALPLLGVFGGFSLGSGASVIGNVFVLLGTGSAAVYVVITHSLVNNESALAVLAWQQLSSLLLAAMLFLVSELIGRTSTQWNEITILMCACGRFPDSYNTQRLSISICDLCNI
jgi:drug/metabolite transporter (DMT)-like permease